MRRAVIAAAATVVGLVALLDYKSASPGSARVAVGGGATVAPVADAPATTSPTPTATGATGSASPAPSGTFSGQDVQYRYGDIRVQVTVNAGRITAISTPEESANDFRSQNINSQAVPILTQEALTAQGVNIDVVSGATYTSDAFAQSLRSAIAEEKA